MQLRTMDALISNVCRVEATGFNLLWDCAGRLRYYCHSEATYDQALSGASPVDLSELRLPLALYDLREYYRTSRRA